MRRFGRERLGLLQFLVPGQEWTEADLELLGAKVRHCSQQVQRFFGFKIPDNSEHATNTWIFRRLLDQLGIKTEARRQGRDQVRSVWIHEEAWNELQTILERRQANRENYQVVAGSESFVTPDVVTPSYINETEGVTTGDQENSMPRKLVLTDGDLQTGVRLLSVIAQGRELSQLELFKSWSETQKQQLWAAVPKQLKQQLQVFLERFQGKNWKWT